MLFSKVSNLKIVVKNNTTSSTYSHPINKIKSIFYSIELKKYTIIKKQIAQIINLSDLRKIITIMLTPESTLLEAPSPDSIHLAQPSTRKCISTTPPISKNNSSPPCQKATPISSSKINHSQIKQTNYPPKHPSPPSHQPQTSLPTSSSS